MRYFVPFIRLSEELPPQTAAQDKLGGLPWGLHPDSWPKCSECGTSQSLLAQFLHDGERLDLGRPGRVLSIFQCNDDPGMCSTWEGGSGANACFVTEPEDLTNGLSPLPPDAPQVDREVRATHWLERDDGISAEEAPRFSDEAALFNLPQSELSKVAMGTKLGGIPAWIQNPGEAPKDGWRFVGQLDGTYSFYEPPAIEDSEVMLDKEQWEGRTHFCEGPNLGDGGIAYLFLRDTATVPDGWFFWQCG